MKGQLLTEVLNPFLSFFGYFNINKYTLIRIPILAVVLMLAWAGHAQSYNNIEFVENKGQWDARVKFRGQVTNGAFFLRDSGFTILQYDPVDYANLARFIHGQRTDGKLVTPTDSIRVKGHSWNVDFVGASLSINAIPDKKIPTYNNYFIGNDPAHWASECRIFQAVTLKDVYPNIDVRYYTDNNFLKYDIIVHPGGDISKIALKYEGIDKVQVKNKELSISTSIGDLKESSPVTYQSGSTGRRDVSCKYTVKNNIVRFEVKDYDPNSTLVIDPSIVFCSFSGSSADNWGFTATYGPDGSMYGGGIVFGTGFPTSPGAFQTLYQGADGKAGVDIGLIKLSPDGSSRMYATYLGGAGGEQPHSLIVDPQGNLIVAGRTDSPVSGAGSYPLFGAFQKAGKGGGNDIVITKLNATGTALIGSVRLGGTGDDGVNISPGRVLNSLQRNYGDDGRSEVMLDGAGNIYLASSTQSTGSTVADRFPVTAGAFQTNPGGQQDAVLIKFSPDLGTLLFSSFFGGSKNDAGYVVNIGPSGNIYMGGGTESSDLPGNTAGTVGTANNGAIDGYVTIINSNGTGIVKTSYIGTANIDQVFGIQFDLNGFLYIMGQTTGSWQVINAAYSNANGRQFISKLQADLSSFVYSTMFGTGAATPNISPVAFLVDRCENVYISGWGGHYDPSNPFNSAGTVGLPVTSDAFKSQTDGKDFYFFVLKKDATSQLFGSFFGEDNIPAGGGDHVDGGTSRFDRNGVIYQAICANCYLINPHPRFPVTAGAWSTSNNAANARNGAGCNLAMLKIAMNLAGVHAGIQPSINGVINDSAGCVPLDVHFRDTIANGQSYEWHFGDGSPVATTTVPDITHTFTAVGNYLVMLVAIDPTTCNVRDTSYVHIRVGDLKAAIDFNAVKLPPCTSYNYQFNNTSAAPPSRPFTAQSFIWDFGDNSPRVVAGLTAVNHTFAGPGTYSVHLVLQDTGYCNAPDSVVKQISVADNVKAVISTPPNGCLLYTVQLGNNSLAGESWLWDFGDGSPTSTAFEPVHTYTAVGTYTIVLVAFNPNTCNKTDTARFTIQVFDAPVPDFSYSPTSPVANTPTVFSNLSSPDAVSFKWKFGDGDSLVTTSRADVKHQYNATGTFNACLTAYNAAGCDSTICRPVQSIIIPLVDVPNAFTPNSGDLNSVVLVQGFGIAKMQFTIWNRWGQKVFETNNRFQGWDGKVKGVVQPMDVYVYTLSVEFSDGTKVTRKGDITLIR